ncbi:hypothetical protein WL80_04690 [Burkholderia ubonensis]|nr:hypothetical protein WL80_04690 [Burkholderia ubonensis]
MRARKAHAQSTWCLGDQKMVQMRAQPGMAIKITARLHRVDRMDRLAAAKVVRGRGLEMSLALPPASIGNMTP